MDRRFFHVDSFTEVPFAGNPAGVCLLAEPYEDTWMQQVAFEMNLSETAFVLRQEGGFSLRWFTPAAEVDLCGHGTLATAHILYELGEVALYDEAVFHTRSGLLIAERKGGLTWLDFPALPEEPAAAPEGLLAALGVEPIYVGKFGAEYLAELATEDDVRRAKPDFRALRALPCDAVVVTSLPASTGCDFVSRCFAPRLGVDEDPVTGSVHCCLGPFWGHRLGKTEMVAYQASARGGIIHLELAGDRVKLGGRAVTVLQGRLIV
ncbi:MAG: PhzF family phenazine biosynthesis protein [Thermoleophilia bacterium]|nr:PhzF family phenazine biosynthesis protein [Thermoleophilia bacterium]